MKKLGHFVAATLFCTLALGATAHAFKIKCVGGYMVFICGDGTMQTCATGNPPRQSSCEQDSSGNFLTGDQLQRKGEIACMDHGGYIRIQPKGSPGDPETEQVSSSLVLEQAGSPGLCHVPEIAFTPDDVYSNLFVSEGFTPSFCGGIVGSWF